MSDDAPPEPVTGYKDCLPLYFCPVTVILDVAVDKDLCFTKLLVFSSVLVQTPKKDISLVDPPTVNYMFVFATSGWTN